MNLNAVQYKVQERLNRCRRLHSLITGELFVALFEASSDQSTAIKHIESNDLEQLNIWIARQRRTILEFMTVADLRLECRLYGIPNYHLLQRDEMIERIRNDRVREREASIDRQHTGVAHGGDGTCVVQQHQEANMGELSP